MRKSDLRQTRDGRTTRTLADSAHEAIRDRIVMLRMQPGSPIKEEHLMRELGVGRTPIREAIKRLALEDLVIVYPRLGSFVSHVHITDLSHISDVRIQLEGHAAYRAAERATQLDRELGKALVEELDQLSTAHHREVLLEADVRVHRFIYSCSRNPYLASTAERFLNLSLRSWYLALDRLPHLGDSVLEHRELLRAVAEAEPELARELASSHVATFEREMRRVL